MKQLEDFICTKQQYDNSCWIAVANAVLSYMHQKNPDLWDQETHLTEENHQGNAINAICYVYKDIIDENYFAVEDKRLPDFDYIKKHIDAGNPLVSLLTVNTYNSPEPDITCKEGHWIALIGYNDDGNRSEVIYYDPDTGEAASFTYGDLVIINDTNMHFANTTLIEISPTITPSTYHFSEENRWYPAVVV